MYQLTTIVFSIICLIQLASHPGLIFGNTYIFDTSVYSVLVFIMSAATNLLATALIAWRAWQFRRNLSQHLQLVSGRRWLGKLMVLLVESGALYLCIMVCSYIDFMAYFRLIVDKVLYIVCMTRFDPTASVQPNAVPLLMILSLPQISVRLYCDPRLLPNNS